jgi:hypothetical protein
MNLSAPTAGGTNALLKGWGASEEAPASFFKVRLETRNMTAGHYRITAPTVALIEESGRRVADLIPKGSIIEVHGEPLNTTDLVDVLWSEKVVLMFYQDLLARTEPMKGRARAASY